MNMLSGKKLVIGVVAAFLAQLVKAITGLEVGSVAVNIAEAIMPGSGAFVGHPLVQSLATWATVAFLGWAATKGFMKIAREKKAGATMAEAGTVIGAVKDAISKGLIPPVVIQPPDFAVPLPAVKLEQIKAVNADVLKKAEV